MDRGRVFRFAFVVSIAGLVPVSAEQAPVPLFSPSADVGWISYGPDFIPAPEGPKPVTFDPAHPFVENGIEYNAARPGTKDEAINSTFPVADLSNPILKPWAREELRKLNERVLAGRPLFSRQSSCWPMGVPGFLLYVVNPVYVLERPNEVVLIATSDHMVRHIYLNVPHSKNPKPSWFGESVGHYEGDALVVDTIGLTTKAAIDNYRTPHSSKLHVVERFHRIDDGKTLEVNLTVEDPDTFTTPWGASQRYVRSEKGPLVETICAENNANYFGYEIDPTPEATRPDF
ncbi:MAG TPA: hypothetical protein VEU06_04305 [Micropepsaceae bacterium]|nr:hypothetical protein [Micropepsaceae bacterium]